MEFEKPAKVYSMVSAVCFLFDCISMFAVIGYIGTSGDPFEKPERYA